MPLKWRASDKPPKLVPGVVVLFSVLVSTFVTVVSAYALFILGLSVYPNGVLGYVPVTLGVLGVAGLIAAWVGDPGRKSSLHLRIQIAFLVSGLLAALFFVFVIFWVVPPEAGSSVTIYALLCLFPLTPALAGVALIVRDFRHLPKLSGPGILQYGKPAALVAVICLLVVALRIGVQEAVMGWYGRDLINVARASAERIANGAPYCVLDHDGARTLEELNKRRILVDAVDKRLGVNPNFVSAHFGIAIDRRAYFWSFKQRQFLALPVWTYPFLSDPQCPYDRQAM